jgi:hypothetical protein
MKKRNFVYFLIVCFVFLSLMNCSPKTEKSVEVQSNLYDDLVSLFGEWREFQKPPLKDGIYDYSAEAMKEQSLGLKEMLDRLAAIDPSSWPVSQQVDYHIVRAEMNGLDFDFRVLKPWSRIPSFYAAYYSSPSDVPALEGPWKFGTLCLWKYSFPLEGEDREKFQLELQAIPAILEQAKENLKGDAKDLWFLGIRQKKRESDYLANLARRMEKIHPGLLADVVRAQSAVDEFGAWLEKKQKGLKASSGIGIENYNWYMKNVHLIPYTWEEQVAILERELARSVESMKLEENRNRNLPQLRPPENREEYQRRHDEALDYFMDFLRENEIMSMPDYLKNTLVRENLNFVPEGQLRDFFTQVDYRDPLPLLCHGTHWFDLARMEHEPHSSPIRSVPLLYNIWDSRAEGLATGFEELMMHAGLMDHKPRARELVYIMLACRAARGMGDLKMHSNEFTLEEAVRYGVEHTPRGWMPIEGNTIWFDEHLYLVQPGYGTSYVVGKVHLDKLIADRSRQMGEGFILKQFMDEFHSYGLIPLSLIRWEMTGLTDEVRKLGIIQ